MATASYFSSHFYAQVIGQEYDFTIYSYNSSHLHKVTLKLGSYTKTWDRVKGGVETTYTVPLTWANAIPNAMSMNGTLTLQTYQSNYSTKVGSAKTETITFKISSTMYPTVNSISLTEAVDGIYEQFGAYVQGKSKIAVNITASGAYGSTIKKYNTSINSVTYTSTSFTTGTIKGYGTKFCTTTITDSRGISWTDAEQFTVLSYTKPKINNFKVARCLEDGTENDEGTSVKVTSDATIDSVSDKNTKAFKLFYKLTTANTWTELDITGDAYSLEDERILNDFDINNTYNFKLEATDFFGTTAKIINLETSDNIMDFLADGTGMAIGKASEHPDTLDIGYTNTYLSKEVYVGGNKNYDGQKNIYFNNTGNGNIEHNSKIYGGDGTSDIAIGIYDLLNNRRVVYYLDTKNTLELDASVKLSNFFNAITMVRSSDELTLSSTSETQIPLMQYAKVGSKLSYSGNNIVIGAGVSVVKVTGSVYFHSGFTENDVVHTIVKRNSDIVNMGIKRIKGAYETLAISDKLISVTEGDVIGLYAMNQTEGRGTIGGSTHATYLTVEVVG